MKHAYFLLLLGLLAVLPRPLPAAPDPEPQPWCGTDSSRQAITIARHHLFERRLERQRRLARAAGIEPRADFDVYQYQQIAVITDNGSLISDPNPVDLAGEAMQFLRRPNLRMSAVRFQPGLKTPYGTRLEIGDDDSVEVEFPADFRFPFGDQVYAGVFVNSDGNLTFGAPDSASTARSLSRFLAGPPRIAPLFTDLDPSAAAPNAGVYLRFLPGRVRVTWFRVPEFGVENHNTVQVTLFTNGRSTVVFGDELEAQEAVVGVSFGGGASVQLLDYTEELPLRPQPAAIAERFITAAEVDDVGVARAFFQYFEDRYDSLLVWLDFQHDLGGGAFAYELTVRNDVRGIGERLYDRTALYGSPGRLASYVQMGSLDRYPNDPGVPALRTFTTLALIAHETAHRWLAKVRYRTASGESSDALLGRQLAHWSFHHDTDASVMEGNDIRDNGDGTFTTVAATTGGYSALDQYLMGLIPVAEVDEFFYVANVASPPRDARPEVGVTFAGDRVDVAVDDVVAAEGERIPAFGDAPDRFRMAFVLLTRQGEPAAPDSLSKLERFRQRWSAYFNEATDYHATVGSAIFPQQKP